MGVFLKILLAIGIILIINILFVFLKALFIKNRKTRILDINNVDTKRKEEYAQKVYELVSIPTSYDEGEETYHIFREKIKLFFPLVHKYFLKEKIGSNVLFTYASHKEKAKKVLIVTHIDTSKEFMSPRIDQDYVYGTGTFDSKTLFYVVLQAIEEKLEQEEKLDLDLTIAMTVDDTSTKQGNEMMVTKFLRQGSFFHLVMEEGVGIIDPSFLKMKSHHALLGIGVTGEVKIRYKIPKNRGVKDLQLFVKEVTENNLFKSKLDKNTRMVLKTLSKDMPFLYRLLFGNVPFFKVLDKRIINKREKDFGKLVKTHIVTKGIEENDKEYYVDLVYELATHDTAAEIVGIVSPYVKKYGLEYDLKDLKDPSKITPTYMYGYKEVEDVIYKTFKNLYVAPYIINKYTEQRYLSRVSDCVIRFSPLFYSEKNLKDIQQKKEYILKASIVYGVDFYKNLIDSFRGE